MIIMSVKDKGCYQRCQHLLSQCLYLGDYSLGDTGGGLSLRVECIFTSNPNPLLHTLDVKGESVTVSEN